MYLYSIMPLDTKRVGELCEDIRRQQAAGVSFSLAPVVLLLQ